MVTEMMISIDILALIFHGFYTERKNFLGKLITTVIIFSVVALNVALNGILVYNKSFSEATISDIIFGIVFVFFNWGLGYYMSYYDNKIERNQEINKPINQKSKA